MRTVTAEINRQKMNKKWENNKTNHDLIFLLLEMY
jgi:hypothetical protein